MADDRKKVSSEQLLILIEEIEKDSSLTNGRIIGAEAKEQYNERWELLAQKLNSVDNGAMKNVAKWQQAWRDWKSNTKKKAAKFAKENEGDTNSQPLTPLEQRVLEMSEAESPERTNGIDISTIAEEDQSSSSDSETDDSDEESGDSDSNPASDIVALFSDKENSENSSKKRTHSTDENKDGVKRRRLNITLETISRQNRRILSRLARLERAQRQFQRRHAALLACVRAMEERLLHDNVGPGG